MPAWANELTQTYLAGNTSVFILHGNVRDLVQSGQSYCSLPEYLSEQIFGSWDVVLQYDLANGVRPLTTNGQRLQSMVSAIGSFKDWPKDPESVLSLLNQLFEKNLVATKDKRLSIALIMDYAQYLSPASDTAQLSRGQGSSTVRLLSWASNPYLKRAQIAICLVVDQMSELNSRLVRNPHVVTIEVPLPEQQDRAAYLQTWEQSVIDRTSMNAEQIAVASNGLTLVNLNSILSYARKNTFDIKQFRRLKNELIVQQCNGMIEIIDPSFDLAAVAGLAAVKERLLADASLIAAGFLEDVPMGYLICGAVGTGKTFLAICFAGSIGIPVVKLLNFRSKYVGESEGNIEHLLAILRMLGPVLVVVDEADAALGNREAEGDSGTSGRIFSSIASQMGDTRYRGKIIWMLLTSRPDLLPIDLKRQGRAEIHLPLFYPQNIADVREMFVSMAKKNKINPQVIPSDDDLKLCEGWSGADIESVLLSARRLARCRGFKSTLTDVEIKTAIKQFLPSSQGFEKETQEIAAVIECTDATFLPEHWAKANRSELYAKFLRMRAACRAKIA